MNGSCKTLIVNDINNELYIGGLFTTITDGSSVITTNNIASLNLNTYKWNKFGGYSSNGTNGIINCSV